MVKFGKHVDFFVGDPTRRRLYVVPYKDVQRRTCNDLPSSSMSAIAPLSAPPRRPPIDLQPPPPPPTTTATPATVKVTNGKSGLSALFDSDDVVVVSTVHNTNDSTNPYDNDKYGCDDEGDVIASPSPRAAASSINVAMTNNAVTITTGTGAELAAALKQSLRVSTLQHRKPTHKAMNRKTSREWATSAETITAAVQFDREGEIFSVERELGDRRGFSANDETEQDREFDYFFMAQRFQNEWRKCLRLASDDFNKAMQMFWKEVFDGISKHCGVVNTQHVGRGALPDAALHTYAGCVPPELAHHTFSLLKDVHATALINAEALRKLVKKFDKKVAFAHGSGIVDGGKNMGGGGGGGLSAKLLPELFAINFTVSLASLEGGLALLRLLLNIDDEEEKNDITSAPSPFITNSNESVALNCEGKEKRDEILLTGGGYFGNRHNKEAVDAELVKGRKEELEWLHTMIAGIDPMYIPHLVAHRGFHSPLDRSYVRPLENSLTAYEAAWTNGINLCECDIALTKDERIILSHDENFARLAMDPTSPLCNKTVRDLTFKELLNCPIKSGARPPLLFDVLRSAAAIGGDAKMVVEIKAGNLDAGTSLARIFVRHPQLMEHVAIVMSFDAFIMHNFRREMAAVYEHMHGCSGSSSGNGLPQQQQPPVFRRELLSRGPGLQREMSTGAPNRVLSHDGELVEQEHAQPPPKPPIFPRPRSSTISSSPHLGPSKLLNSHGRLPSMMGAHQRIDSRDLFGLGASYGGLNSMNESAFGLNLAEIDAYMSSSSPPTTFLPNIHKSVINTQQQQQQQQSPYHPSSSVAANASKDGGTIKLFPKILLLSVNDMREPDDHHQFVDFTDPDKVTKLLRGGDGGSLDGIYMQYQKEMITSKGSKAMRNLAAMYDVGVWGTSPDDWDTFHTLVNECHVSYVNTDLPRHFRRKMKRSISANSLVMNGILARQ